MLLTPELFLSKIEDMVEEHDINHMEAVLLYCDDNSLDTRDILSLITVPLKERIKLDAMNNGLMKMEAQLPV
jgi:hypothetical protein